MSNWLEGKIKQFYDADVNPATAYELGRYDERMKREFTKEELAALGEAYAVQLGDEVKGLILAARKVIETQSDEEIARLKEALKPFEP